MPVMGSNKWLPFMVALLVFANFVSTIFAIEIPSTWRKVYELEPDQLGDVDELMANEQRFVNIISAADVYADWLGLEVQKWRPSHGGKVPGRPQTRTVHLVNLDTGESKAAVLPGKGYPINFHFVGNSGLVFTGSYVLYDHLREVRQIELREVLHRMIHRVSDYEFVVNDVGVLHSVDFSDVASGRTKLKELSIPQGTELPHCLVSKDYVVRWSRASGHCLLALFNRENGQLLWSDQADGPILGISPDHVYMSSERVVNGYAKRVLVRRAVVRPFRAESILFPTRTFRAVIDFNWPNLLLVVHQQADGGHLVVNVDVERQSIKQFDFRDLGEDIRISEGNALARRTSFRDQQSDKKYGLFGDARHDRLIVVADRTVYSVPLVDSLTYEWPDWNWQPYRTRD
jgi:hypothetical protein